MPRVKNSVATRRRRKSILKLAKGYRGSRRRLFKNAKETVQRALRYAFRDRRAHKRNMRSLWIVRVNAVARENGMSYSRLICGLQAAGVELDRKALAYLAVNDPQTFAAVVDKARSALEANTVRAAAG